MTTIARPTTSEEFLDFLLPYAKKRRQDQIRDILALTRRGGFRAPEKILIILFPSRAGSNYFGQLLSSTGWFNLVGESFSPPQLIAVKEREKLNDLHEAAQWMIDNRGTEHAFGFKAGFKVLTAAAELGFLPEVIDRAQLVLLRRRDRIAQAVSAVKGLHTGKTHSRQPLQRPLEDDDYDGEAIAANHHSIVLTEVMQAEFVERLGKTAPLYFYEDICAEPEQHVTAVCDLMGLTMPDKYEPKKVTLEVLRDDLSRRWAERFRSEYPGRD